jgi:hypothetical protein
VIEIAGELTQLRKNEQEIQEAFCDDKENINSQNIGQTAQNLFGGSPQKQEQFTPQKNLFGGDGNASTDLDSTGGFEGDGGYGVFEGSDEDDSEWSEGNDSYMEEVNC